MNRLPLVLTSLLLLVPLAPLGHASPATVTVNTTSYSTGGHFHVDGTVTDPDGVARVYVAVPGGFGAATVTGSNFSADVTGTVYGPGTYNLTITVYDSLNVATITTTTVNVTGVYTVFYDRTVHTSVGAYANYEEIVIPHSYGGVISIDNLDLASAVVVQQANTGAAIPMCVGLGLLDAHYDCSFSVRPTSSPFEIVWLQAPENVITVTLSGYLL